MSPNVLGADTKAILRAAEALTTEVRRIADAVEKPVVEAVMTPQPPVSELERAHAAIARVRTLLPDNPVDDLCAPGITPGGLRVILDDALGTADARTGAGTWVDEDEGHAEPPTEEGMSQSAPARLDQVQPAFDAVTAYIRGLGEYLPPDLVHRNAIIWHAVHAGLGATPVGRCISSHCVEGDHILPIEQPGRPS